MEKYFQIRKVRIWIFLKATFPYIFGAQNDQVSSLKMLDLVGDFLPFVGLLLTLTCSQREEPLL